MARPPHLADSKYVGFVTVFFTVTTKDNIAAFSDDGLASNAIEQLLQCGRQFNVEIPAYSLLPDHGHVLAIGTAIDTQPLAMVHRWKQLTGYRYRKETGHFLWQPGVWDRVLRDGDDVGETVEYTLLNPVQAGLVRDIADYKWSGSSRMSLSELAQRCNGPRHGKWWW
jgi:REP element-mobilizing transposase RayT